MEAHIALHGVNFVLNTKQKMPENDIKLLTVAGTVIILNKLINHHKFLKIRSDDISEEVRMALLTVLMTNMPTKVIYL